MSDLKLKLVTKPVTFECQIPIVLLGVKDPRFFLYGAGGSEQSLETDEKNEDKSPLSDESITLTTGLLFLAGLGMAALSNNSKR